MPLSQEYQYIYKYYCKKYGERKARKVLADKPVKFLSRANDICKWKDSFDKGDFYELKKLDDTSINTRYYGSKTKFADRSRTNLGEGFGSGVSIGIVISFIFTIAWFFICSLFKINYSFHFLSSVAPFLIGATLLAGGVMETVNFIARMCLFKRQNEFPYASLYIEHCSKGARVESLLYIPKIELELIDIYYDVLSHALQDKITTHKDQLYNKLNDFCQSANYHDVVCRSRPSPSYYGSRRTYNKTLMPFSNIREHFDEPKGFEVLMALLNPNNITSTTYNYDVGYFDSAFFTTKPQKKDKVKNELLVAGGSLVAIILSFCLFKFPFVWHQQIPLVIERHFQEKMGKYNQACSLIESNYQKKLQQPVYLLGISVNHRLIYNGGIGNDWRRYAKVNGKGVGYSELTIPVIIGDELKFYSEMIEVDPSSDDVGLSQARVSVTQSLIESGFTTTLTTTVSETHGRGAGESAEWESSFHVRVIDKLDYQPEGYTPQKDPYPSKPVKESKDDINSWEVFKSTIKNIV